LRRSWVVDASVGAKLFRHEKLIRKIQGSGTEIFWLGDLTS
jgi:hypothetical protein